MSPVAFQRRRRLLAAEDDMETKIRIRHGDLEVEWTGDDVFVTTRLPDLLSELLRRIRSQNPAIPQPAPEPRPIGITGDVRDYFTGSPGVVVTAEGPGA